MANPYILAKTMKDAHAFAQESLDLRPGRYRVVTSSSSISGPRGADLYLVPGWEERFDRFAVKGALRYTRLNVIDVATAEVFLVKAPEPQTDGLIPAGTQLTLDDASAFFDDISNGNSMIAEGSPDPFGEQFEIVPDRVDTLQAISDEIAAVEDAPAKDAQLEPPAETPAPAEPEKKRRRTRCKSCNTLHFKDDSCPEAE